MIVAAEKFWILDPLYGALGQLLAWFYAVIPSFGVAIMLLTVAVSILRMPLVAKQVKSQAEMQKIQPELRRIQQKYKTDPQKRNEEMMRLYKEHSVNPFAGCLPLLLQMPLFIVLYRLILNLSNSAGPKHIPTGSELYRALRESGGVMRSFGMDLAQKASSVQGFGKLLPYLLLIGLVLATGYYQQRQMTARLPKDGAANQQMLLMTKILPIFLAVVSWSIPAGVVLYFLVSNIWQIGQQAFLFKKKEAEEAAAAAKGGGKKSSSGGGAGAGGGGAGGGDRPSLAKRDKDSAVDGQGVGSASTGSEPRGLFGRLAKALGTPDGPAAGARQASGGGSPAGGRADRGRSGAASARRPGGKPAGKQDASGNGRGGAGSAKGSAGRAGSGNGRVTPRGGGRAQPKGSKSRNSRRGK